MTRLGARPEQIGPASAPASPDVLRGRRRISSDLHRADQDNRRFFRPASRSGHFLFDLPGYIADACPGLASPRSSAATHDTAAERICSSVIGAPACAAKSDCGRAPQRSRSRPDRAMPYVVMFSSSVCSALSRPARCFKNTARGASARFGLPPSSGLRCWLPATPAAPVADDRPPAELSRFPKRRSLDRADRRRAEAIAVRFGGATAASCTAVESGQRQRRVSRRLSAVRQYHGVRPQRGQFN